MPSPIITKLVDGGIVRGNVFSIRRTIYSIPTTVTLSSAKLTVKTNTTDADPGIFQITAAVEDSGASGTAIARFDFTAANTNALTAGVLVFFDLQYTFSNGNILTLETGQFQAVEKVTT